MNTPWTLRARLCGAVFFSLIIATTNAQRVSLRANNPNQSKQKIAEATVRNSKPAASANAEDNGHFSVKSFSPQSVAPLASVISATFNRDVATTETIDARKAPDSVFSFEPSIEGSVQWESPREVRFIPARRLRHGSRYIARINPLLRDASGEQLSDAPEYRFNTPALSLKTAQQARFTEDRRVVINLEFSDKVKPADLRKFLTLRVGTQKIGWKPQSEVASNKPNIITDPLSTDTLNVILQPGLKGVDGPLGIANRVEMPVKLDFRLTAVSANGDWESGRPRLKVRFSSYVGSASAEKYVTVTPEAKISFSSEGNDLVISGDFEPEKRYTVKVKKGFRSYYDKILLENVTLSAWMPPMAPFLNLPESSGHLGTNSRMKLRVRSAAINKVTVAAHRLFDNNMVFNSVSYGSRSGLNNLGRKIGERKFDIPMTKNKAQTTEVDLRDLLGPDATGIYSIEVRGETPDANLLLGNNHYYSPDSGTNNSLFAETTINLSNLGIVGKVGHGSLTAFIAALDTAKPLQGIEVRLFSRKNQLLGDGVTDSDGIVRIGNLHQGDTDEEPAVIIAQSPDKREIALLNLDENLSNREQFSSTGRDFLSTGYESYLTTERGAYRPGEAIHVSGFIRGRDSATPAAAFPVESVLRRPDGKSMTPQVHTPTATGLLDFKITIPDYAPTGQYTVLLRMPGTGDGDDYNDADILGRTTFLLEEFVPNRVKVEANAPDKRYSLREPLIVSVGAEEMFGQPIVNQPVTGSVTWIPKAFEPEQWPGFTFGDDEKKFNTRQLPLFKRTLSKDGKTTFSITPPKGHPPAALEAEVQVTVNDGGRGVTRRITRTVDPTASYLGIKEASNTYSRPGEQSDFEIVSVNPDGSLSSSDETLTGTVYRVNWNSNLVDYQGSYSFKTTRQLVPTDTTTVTLSGGRGVFSWTPKSVGSYLVSLGGKKSGASVSKEFYASSSTWNHQPWSLEKPETADLVLDKDSYSAGDTVRLIIKAPFPGTVLLTLEQDHVLSSTILQMTENTLEVPIHLTEDMLPNVYAVASVIRPVQPARQWLPHRAVGMVNIPVTAGSRILDIKLDAPEEVRPGADMDITAELRDRMTSAPVSGDIIVWAVDEGILSLTDFNTPEPGNFFAKPRRLMVDTADFYSNLMPDLITAAQTASATGGGDMATGPRLSPIDNERVKSIVLWQGPARTDANGQLRIHWKTPPFMGRLRVMAMAADGKRFGSGDTATFVRNPVMVKQYLPRFVAPGDRFQAGFTVFNNTDSPSTPTLNVAAGNMLTVDRTTSQTLDVIPPRGQFTVFREMTAAPERTGQAPVRFEATTGVESFASSVTLPVRPGSPRIRQSESVAIKSGETATVKIPGENYLPDTTTVTLMAGGRPDLELAGALTYNVEYPYGCTEQVVSGLFPLLYLPDLAKASAPGRFSDVGIRAMVQQGIDRVLMAQTAGGGLSMWVGDRDDWPWASIYGAHFLVEAKKAGYQVNPDYYNALLSYLSQIVSTSSRYATRDDLTRRAYAGYVLARSGRKVQQKLGGLHEALSKMSEEARALLASAYLESGMRPETMQILKATELSDTNKTGATRQSGDILASPARETALLLMAWTDADVDSTHTSDLVRRLLDMRERDKWGSTQDNSFAMLALGRYVKKIADKPSVSGTVRVGGKTYDFSTSRPLTLSRANLAGAEATIESVGDTAYVWYSAEGVPVTPPNEPVENGLSISRRYLDRAGKTIDPTELKQGQLVVVELSIGGKRQLQNVVIQDLLPAGLEVENPRLSSTESTQEADEMNGISVNRVDLRDDRILIFADLLQTKKENQTYRYTARAVTPGDFMLPPAMIDVMYDPAVNARTAPGRARIAPRK